MTPQQAEQLLRSELASNTPVGKALTVLIQDAEMQNYRQSAKTSDAFHLSRICGRGEGINSLLTRITPVRDAASESRPSVVTVAGDFK